MGPMERTPVNPGDVVLAVDAFGAENPRRALTGVVPGGDFPVVWICREEEWEASQREGREPDGVPWPVEDVRVGENADPVVAAQ
jgi:hypothetical protein